MGENPSAISLTHLPTQPLAFCHRYLPLRTLPRSAPAVKGFMPLTLLPPPEGRKLETPEREELQRVRC